MSKIEIRITWAFWAIVIAVAAGLLIGAASQHLMVIP